MTKTRVHKVDLLIVNTDDVSDVEIRELLTNARYPNHCISPQVKAIRTCEVDWSDDHPLNKRDTCEAAYRELFPPV